MNRSKYDGAGLNALECRIERGSVYEFTGTLSIANSGGVGEWFIKTGSKTLVIEERRITTEGDELTYEAFGGPVLSSDGTAKTVGARNSSLPNTSEVQVFESPTVTSPGTVTTSVYMPGASGQGNSTVGNFDLDGLVRIVPPYTEFLLRITNDGTANPAKTQIYLTWAELNDPTPE